MCGEAKALADDLVVIEMVLPDILEWKIKWVFEASLQTKLVEVMEFQLS